MRVGPPHVARVTLLACAGVFALLAAFLVVAGIVTIGDNPAGGVARVMAGAVVLALAELLRRMARSDPTDPLTILVGADDIGFERGGQVVDRVPRAEVGVIVLEEHGRAGVRAVTVRGPHGDLVGRWETGWLGRAPCAPTGRCAVTPGLGRSKGRGRCGGCPRTLPPGCGREAGTAR